MVEPSVVGYSLSHVQNRRLIKKRNSNEKQKSNFRQPNEATNFKLYYIENQQKITRLIAIFEQTNSTKDKIQKIPTEANVRVYIDENQESLDCRIFFVSILFFYTFFRNITSRRPTQQKRSNFLPLPALWPTTDARVDECIKEK